MVSISKAEHLPSFWNRDPGELENGLLQNHSLICVKQIVPPKQSVSIFFKFVHPCLILYLMCYLYIIFIS